MNQIIINNPRWIDGKYLNEFEIKKVVKLIKGLFKDVDVESNIQIIYKDEVIKQ